MKKYRIRERIFAVALVICMMITMMPVNAIAATKGDIVTGDMGMTDINYDDKIIWPIEIYDYANDGMLFEYASYTGNAAKWAQLDKDEEYCYIPELLADYYADYTTDEIVNTQVVRRWFDVWGTTYTQTQNTATGMKYFTFPSLTGTGVELIDFRDPNSDDVINWSDSTISYGNGTFNNAYGYTFIIDDVDGEITGGDSTLITSATAYDACNPYWAISVEFAPTGNDNEYKVVKTEIGNANNVVSSSKYTWGTGYKVMVIHGDMQSNWMDRLAAEALKAGDIVTISDNNKYVTVKAPANETKSGTVSKDKVKYATLVYRTQGGEYENVYFSPTYANGYDWTNLTSQIYVFANTDGATPNDVAYGATSTGFFGTFNGILLTYNSTSGAYEVTAVDFASDGTNDIANTALASDQIAIIFHESTSETHEYTYNYLKKYATVGRPFAFTTGTLTALQSDSGALISDDTAEYVLATGVLKTETGTINAFLREVGSENRQNSVTKEIVLGSADLGSDWRYVVFDLSSVNAGEIQSAGVSLDATSSGNNYDLLVSHFALFETEAEATVYGEKALVNNKHYLQKLYPDNATYSTDFTTSEVANTTKLESYWWEQVYGMTENATTDGYAVSYENGRQHYTFTGNTTMLSPEMELIDFNPSGGVDRDKLKYAVLVCRTSDVGYYSKVGLYFRDASAGTSYGNKYLSVDIKDVYDTDDFVTLIFDLSGDGTEYFASAPSDKVYSAGLYMTNYADTSYTLDSEYNFDVRQFAFFDNEDDAEAYAEQITVYNQYTGVPTSYYNPIYDNLGYGFLMQSKEGALYNKYEKRLGYNFMTTEDTHASLADKIYYLAAGYGGTVDENTTYDGNDLSALPFDGYNLYATLTEGSFTAGLVDATLGSDGNPVYRGQVIDYLAQLLASTLVIPEYEGGYFNYEFVRGEALPIYGGVDLATALRSRIGINFEENDKEPVMGNLASTLAKASGLIGTWAQCEGNIETCYDAAYFLLNNLFVEGSYNELPEDTYDYLILNKASVTTGDETKDAYVFDAGLTTSTGTSALDYDKEKKTIGYIDAAHKHLYYTSSDVVDSDGNVTTPGSTTTLYPFLPITADNTEEGMTKSPYFADPGVSYDGVYGETYWERDFNYVIKSSGEFVYHEEDGLFFDFEGDDDVYLFINGQLVLDIGGAHSITKEKINVNDYVYAAREAVANGSKEVRDLALDLSEGEVCTFDFFYMERHGYGANCRIATNLRVTDPAVKVDKTAYQNGEEVNYGGVVEAGTKIEYKFAMTNTGNTKLYNIAFDDPFIGVSIDSINGLKAPTTTDVVMAEDGSTLDARDIKAIVTGYKKVTDGTGNYNNENGNMVEVAVGEGEYIATRNEITFDNNEELKLFMATLEDGEGGLEGDGSDVTTENTGAGAGLWINSTLTIEGIYYKLTSDQKNDGYFNNTVYVTATTLADTTQTNCETLQSSDTHRVYVPSQPYYYQWAGHDIVITKSKLVDDIMNAKDSNGGLIYDSIYDKDAEGNPDTSKTDFTADNINTIELTTSNGQPITLSQVTVDAESHDVTVNYTDEGTHVFYLKITYYNSTKTITVPVVINVTDVKDAYVVLDYGLTVDLTEENGIFSGNNITIPDKMNAPEVLAITGVKDGNGADYTPSYTSSYNNNTGDHRINFNADVDRVIAGADGDFTLSNNKLTYTPDNFMDGIDTIWAAVRLYESGYTTPAGLGEAINISKEVQMYQGINVLPANVVYYEDDFPAIHYKDKDGNALAEDVFTQIGSNDNLTQSADQNQEYGQDNAYATNTDKSGNSITQIEIGASGQVAYFDFTGTGFELISKTNATNSAKLAVKVFDANGNQVKNIPVITEFDHGADGGDEVIHQVPVIRVNDLTYGTYRVTVSGVPARDYTKNADGKYLDPTTNYEKLTNADDKDNAGKEPYIIPTTLYIDGLRIYQPLAEETETTDDSGNTVTTVTPGKNEHYNESENGAIFQEIRNLILDEKVAVAKYNLDSTTVFYGTITWTENRNNETYDGTSWTVNQVNSANDYLALGPNNEVYMDSEDGTAALVFYVNEVGTGTHNLQIALRAIDRGLFYGNDSTGTTATIVYGVDVDGEFQWKELVTANSATEQYYTIDYSECPYIDGKGFQVAIKATSGMVSYSSIKYNGLVLGEMSEEVEQPTLEYKNGFLKAISSMLASDIPYVEEDINEIHEEILYQVRDNSDVRLIAFVDGLKEYSKVSFTLTIDGKESKELVCTTAYAGLYAAGNLYTAEDIYEKDGYFVAYTINEYVDLFAGQEVTITVTYTSTTGEIFTDARTITIEAEK